MARERPSKVDLEAVSALSRTRVVSDGTAGIGAWQKTSVSGACPSRSLRAEGPTGAGFAISAGFAESCPNSGPESRFPGTAPPAPGLPGRTSMSISRGWPGQAAIAVK